LGILEEVFNEPETAHDHEVRHYPSSASFRKADGSVAGACLRAMYWRSTKEPETDPRDLTSKLQAAFGQGIHDQILKRLQKSKRIRITPEASGRLLVDPLTKEISFRLDGLCTYHGEVGGLEIKTQQSYGLQRMVRENGPKEGDLLQVLSYFGTNPDIQWFDLLYFARDTAFRAEYHVWKDPDTSSFMVKGVFPETSAKRIQELNFNGIVNRWQELEQAISTSSLPDRDYRAVLTKEGKFTEKRTKNLVDYKSDWRCTYCSFKTKCWEQMPDAAEKAYKVGS
jgi:hypothetical protein